MSLSVHHSSSNYASGLTKCHGFRYELFHYCSDNQCLKLYSNRLRVTHVRGQMIFQLYENPFNALTNVCDKAIDNLVFFLSFLSWR